MSQWLTEGPIGTPHPMATCCWCGRSLVVGQVLQKRCWLCPEEWRRQVNLALVVTPGERKQAQLLGVTPGTSVCLNVPLPSQALFEECPAKNILWGGQAGPGKSHGVRWWLYKRSLTVPGHEALLTRENWDQLEKTHIRRMKQELPLMGAALVDREARFPQGSFIDCGHMADAEAVGRYLSTEYCAIVSDEASQTPTDSEGITPLAELSTRARKELPDVRGVVAPPRFLPVSNPGGPSSEWLLRMFVDNAPDYEVYPALLGKYKPEQWAYIPARLEDNPYMREDYADTDLAVLSKVRYQQLRGGDWRVFSGQFFQDWQEARHVQLVSVPTGARWFRSMDWGYNQPGCVLWWVVLGDGRLYVRSELKFQRKDVSVVAAEIQKRDRELGIRGGIPTFADPSMWSKTGVAIKGKFQGESVAETFQKARPPIALTRADNDRVNGWMRCHQILRTAPDGQPWFLVHPDCRYLIRSIPAAKSDKHDADDVDTAMDDHALDAWRYGAMSRPAPKHELHETRVHPESVAGLRDKAMRDGKRARKFGQVA